MATDLKCFKCGRGMEDMVNLHRLSTPGTTPAVWACTAHTQGTGHEPDETTRTIMDALTEPFSTDADAAVGGAE